ADGILNRTRQQLIHLLNDSITNRPEIYMVENMDIFESLIGGRFPDWGAAAALPLKNLIVVKSPDSFNLGRPLYELLSHEYAHLALHHRTGRYAPPRWFDEGLAMMVSAEWSWTDNLAMSRAAVFGRFIRLLDIEQMNRFNSVRAHQAYAQSYLAVQYLYREYGREAVNVFLDEIAAGATVDSALMASIGSDYWGFQQEFNIYLTQRFNAASLFMDTIYLWIALAIVVIIGGLLRMKSKRDYFKKWEEDEKLHSTDFDYGDPDHPEKTDDDEPWRN
ncbi:MAG: peptidase MA family metallohydrolase, partial [Candidatus Zixiibacteriota bacterium]